MNLKYIISLNLVIANVLALPKFYKMQDITLSDLSFRTIITSQEELIIGCNNGEIYIYQFNGSQFQLSDTKTQMASDTRYIANSEKYNIMYAGESNNVDLYSYSYLNHTQQYIYDATDTTLTGSTTTDLTLSQDSDYFVHVIDGFGAYVYKYNGTDFVNQYNVTVCVNAQSGRISEDILVLGCNDGSVRVYSLGQSSANLLNTFSHHTTQILSVYVNMTSGYFVSTATDNKGFIYKWNGTHFQLFQEILPNVFGGYSSKILSDSEYVYIVIGTQAGIDFYYYEIDGGASNFTLLQQYQDEVGSNTFGLGISQNFKFMAFFAFNTGGVRKIFVYFNLNYSQTITTVDYQNVSSSDNSNNSGDKYAEQISQIAERVKEMQSQEKQLEELVIAAAVLFGIGFTGGIVYILRDYMKRRRINPGESKQKGIRKGKRESESTTNLTKNNTLDQTVAKRTSQSLEHIIQEIEQDYNYMPRRKKNTKDKSDHNNIGNTRNNSKGKGKKGRS